VQLLSTTGWSLTTEIIQHQCFKYVYDGRNRMIIKQVPGAGEEWMVYDRRDRLVMSRDASLRQRRKWLYKTYDDLGSDVATSLRSDANNRAYNEFKAKSFFSYPNYSYLVVRNLPDSTMIHTMS
jgi:hypothetical protein